MYPLPNGNCQGYISPNPHGLAPKPDAYLVELGDMALLANLRAEATKVEAITRVMAQQLRELRDRR